MLSVLFPSASPGLRTRPGTHGQEEAGVSTNGHKPAQ